MNRVIAVGLTVIALAGASVAMAAPQSRYIDVQQLDANALREVSTIALLEIPDPEAYYYAGGKPGWKSMNLGIIGLIAEMDEMGKNSDQYPGVDFAQSLQAYLEQFLSENNYRIVDHAIERRDRFDLVDEYSGLKAAGADAYLDVALLEIGYLYEADFIGAEIKPVATAIVRLVSAETLQVIYARTFQYGGQPYIHSESKHILSPESHVYESKEDLDLDKPRASERLDRALEVIAFNIARSVTTWGKFASHLSPTMEDVADAGGDPATAEFFGTAATEVALKTYDEKLWRQSGNLSDGSAEEQAGIYIKLRSKRLADIERRAKQKELAKLNESISSSVSGPVYLVAGDYDFQVTGKNSSDFKRKYKRGSIVLEQSGDKVTGTFGSAGQIEGTIKDRTVTFDFYAGHIEGRGKWTIADNGMELRGTWAYKRSSLHGKWNLKKSDSLPIVLVD